MLLRAVRLTKKLCARLRHLEFPADVEVTIFVSSLGRLWRIEHVRSRGQLCRGTELTATRSTFTILTTIGSMGEKVVRLQRTFGVEVVKGLEMGCLSLLAIVVLGLRAHLVLFYFIGGYIEVFCESTAHQLAIICQCPLIHLTTYPWLPRRLHLQLLKTDKLYFLWREQHRLQVLGKPFAFEGLLLWAHRSACLVVSVSRTIHNAIRNI